MNSPIKWRGGKRNLRNEIIKLIPEHHCYVEPFFGAGWIYFRKEKSNVEVINDINKDLITFFNVIKNDYNSFNEKLGLYLISRDEFNYLKNLNSEEIDDIMIAYKFYYINKNSFGGDMSSFNSYYRDKPYFNDKSIKLLEKVHKRLKETWIENQDYRKIIKKFDRKDTFFYLDPPYYKTNNGSYGDNKNIDFQELKNVLMNTRGKFLLSVNNDAYIREIFKDFNINEIKTRYSMSKDINGRNEVKELFIKNY